MTVQQYVESRIAAALEALESGIQMQNIKEVRIAMATLQSLEGIIGYKRGGGLLCEPNSYERTIQDAMVRAASAMCVLDRKNGLQYLQIGSQYDKNNTILLNNYGFCYAQTKQWDKAILAYESCLSADRTYAVAYLGLSSIYRALSQYEKELDVCREGLAHCAMSAEMNNSHGLALLHNRTKQRVSVNTILASFQKGLECSPSAVTQAKLLVNIGHVHGLIGEYPIAVAHYLDATKADPANRIAYQNILANLAHFSDPELSRSPVIRRLADAFSSSDMVISPVQASRTGGMSRLSSKLHKQLCAMMFSTAYSKKGDTFKPDEQDGRKIRVGYLVADPFEPRLNSCARHLWTSYNHHGFSVSIYHNSSNVPLDLHRNVKWSSTADRSAEEVADEISRDKIDILIDLCGHNPGNRLDVMALRPAPVLLSYLGYLTDTGVRHVQRLSDKYCERRQNIDASDQALQLPSDIPFVAYSGPKADLFPVLVTHVKTYSRFKPASSPVTFGCFALLSKINTSVIATWKMLLTRFPRGRLVIRSSLFSDPDVCDTWKTKFATVMTHDRISLIPEAEAEVDRMAQYKMIDVHLDTFPASDLTATLESLYMNVPVITLAPQHRDASQAQLATASVLKDVGLTDRCVAVNLSDYIDKAVDICNSFQNVSVRKQFLKSRVHDTKGFMKIYENLLIDIYFTEHSTNPLQT